MQQGNTPMERWVIHRIGLINFWYYDQEEFEFEGGRLLLRGANGSGKSVTMQSFIPLLLDGNKSPERLDPFGSRSRRIENYLLMDEYPDIEDNTGYLYMEFIKADSGHTITLGMGLRARKGKPLDFWGFALTDGRRVGESFQLFKEGDGRIPLSRTELRNRIGDGGVFCDTQNEYMAMVNQRLFGFQQTDAFDGLIKLLIQIRTPKLSKEFKPTVVTDILKSALQPLSDDDLRPMSEAIENMDGIRSQLDLLEQAGKAADIVQAEYDRYNRAVAGEKARGLLKAMEQVQESEAEQQKWIGEERQALERADAAAAAQEERQRELESCEHRRVQLEAHDSFRAGKELEEVAGRLDAGREEKRRKDQRLEEKHDLRRRLSDRLKETAEAREAADAGLARLLAAMAETADDLSFDEHHFMAAELKAKPDAPFAFEPVRRECERLEVRIRNGVETIGAEREANRRHDETEQELGLARDERDHRLRDRERAEMRLQEAREALTEEYLSWRAEQVEFTPDEESDRRIVRAVQGYGLMGADGMVGGMDRIAEAARAAHDPLQDCIRRERQRHELEVRDQMGRLEENAAQLELWRRRRDPEPPRSEATEACRERLNALGIPHVPFYRAVEFTDAVDDGVRDAMEAALEDMGVLDALVVPAKHREWILHDMPDLADRILMADAGFFQQDLSEYLRPVPQPDGGVSGEDIDEIIRSIRMGDLSSRASVDEQGRFTLGILQGRAKPRSARFLGALARERYRLSVIEQLESDRAVLAERLDAANIEIERLDARLARLRREWEAFGCLRGRTPMEAAFQEVQRLVQAIAQAEFEVQRREKRTHEALQLLKAARERMTEATAGLSFALVLDVWKQADADMRRYRNDLGELSGLHAGRLEKARLLHSIEEQVETVDGDLDNLRHELGVLQRQLDALADRRDNLERVLKEMGHEAIRQEIASCLAALARLPAEIQDAVSRRARAEADAAHARESRERLEPLLEARRRLHQVHAEGFADEAGLGLTAETQRTVGEQADAAGALPALARRCLAAAAKESRSREELARRMQEVFHEQHGALTEFHPQLLVLFDMPQTDVPEDEREIRRARSRLTLHAKARGMALDWKALVGYIRSTAEETGLLLAESDRRLFEDILANTVGRRIRERIYDAEKWVERMNGLMGGMNTSSGLTFSLVWKGRTAETEEQMDARELVELLKMDPALVGEEKMAQLSRHFRSRIQLARRRLEDRDGGQSFHALMRDQLDYREWFEFLLMCRKSGQPRRELTNNLFFSFSGGEKAMAMYVPLFSAVYARYEGARPDCPRLISLDEAFAGVDTNNIRDMFKLLVNLDLDFIMNSQAIWGDCDTVPALSVYELLRPNNEDCVTTIRYRWNGSMRELVLPERGSS